MPCWKVRQVTVEFKAQNVDMLEQALKASQMTYKRNGNYFTIYNGIVNIDVDAQAVSYSAGNESFVNRIKVAYSTEVVKAVAAKKNWILKQNANNKQEFQARRY